MDLQRSGRISSETRRVLQPVSSEGFMPESTAPSQISRGHGHSTAWAPVSFSVTRHIPGRSLCFRHTGGFLLPCCPLPWNPPTSSPISPPSLGPRLRGWRGHHLYHVPGRAWALLGVPTAPASIPSVPPTPSDPYLCITHLAPQCGGLTSGGEGGGGSHSSLSPHLLRDILHGAEYAPSKSVSNLF